MMSDYEVGMNKPEMLTTVTVGETRDKYRANRKALNNMMLLVMTGCMEEVKELAGEWVINQVLTETILQQEYIRERERANWGWDRGVVDFSKNGSILNEVGA